MDRSLLEDLDDAFIQFMRNTLHHDQSAVHEDAGATWFSTSIPMPVFQGVYRTRITEPGAICEVIERVRSGGRAASWFVGPLSEPADLAERLESLGLPRLVTLTGLGIGLRDLAEPPVLPEGVEIREAQSEDDVRTYARLYPLLFGMEDNTFIDELVEVELASWRSGDDHVHRLLAFRDGQAVAAGATGRSGETARLDTLLTLPEHRNLGIGTALATMGLRREQSEGATRAIIWAGPGAEKLYVKMGFRELCRAPIYGIF